jgi:SAM-dependent methyltransferase
MTAPLSKTQSDFDRISTLPAQAWNHNDHYHGFLLKQLPASSELPALEIGCGTGAFTRLLAQRFRQVLGLDLSPGMIEQAKACSTGYDNVAFQVADALAYDLPAARFGCIASIATLHHLPFEPILRKMKDALAPGGSLLVLDLFQAESLADYSAAALAMPLNLLMKLLKEGRLREPAEVRAAWDEHGRSDAYMPLSQIHRAAGRVLPGARIRRQLFWRYSLVWKKELL